MPFVDHPVFIERRHQFAAVQGPGTIVLAGTCRHGELQHVTLDRAGQDADRRPVRVQHLRRVRPRRLEQALEGG